MVLPKEQQVKTNGGAGLNKDKIMLNTDTFKSMCNRYDRERDIEQEEQVVRESYNLRGCKQDITFLRSQSV